MPTSPIYIYIYINYIYIYIYKLYIYIYIYIYHIYREQDIYFSRSYVSVSPKPLNAQYDNEKFKKYKV